MMKNFVKFRKTLKHTKRLREAEKNEKGIEKCKNYVNMEQNREITEKIVQKLQNSEKNGTNFAKLIKSIVKTLKLVN